MSMERTTQGLTGTTGSYCSVGTDTVTPTPTSSKQPYTAPTNAVALGFTIADYVYFGYGMTSGGGATGKCSWTGNQPNVYTFLANGDLDNDGLKSTFELAAGTDKDATLFHAKGFFIVNEIE
jgi:hypothetical protein